MRWLPDPRFRRQVLSYLYLSKTVIQKQKAQIHLGAQRERERKTGTQPVNVNLVLPGLFFFSTTRSSPSFIQTLITASICFSSIKIT
ncbi:hypothetical protein QVD17_27452 [Tagetes erecta]|uniref:Uncharacterized protein n=1 Tax=Tagetes erecta TaxID=13708 RepID=A0AAD8NR40_TARER|nr:hypothetical protein QVD17_27452 [Tagetes erecta]